MANLVLTKLWLQSVPPKKLGGTSFLPDHFLPRFVNEMVTT